MRWENQQSLLPFRDRAEAGRLLGIALTAYAHKPDALVLGLPRGGVPVACEVALALDAPLDVFVVRKLGAPGNLELAIGAVAPGATCILQEEIIAGLKISREQVDAIAVREEDARRQNENLFRRSLAPHPIAGRTVILVDDGVATGATMRAAICALRQLQAGKVVVAVPVAPVSTCHELQDLADQVVCLATPDIFFTVGQWYVNFEQVNDRQLAALLERASTLITRSESCHSKS